MLIPNKEILDQYLSANADLAYSQLQRYLWKADELFILDPLSGIGQPLYDELTGAGPFSPKQEKVLAYLRTAAADYAAANWTEIHSIQRSNSGVSVVRTEHVAPASDAKLEKVSKIEIGTAYAMLEKAMEYLEKNAGDFPAWKTSEAYTIRRELLISSVTEFQQLRDIGNSRRTFMQLRPWIREAEVRFIRQELGDNLYFTLKAEHQSQTLTLANEKLLDEVRRIIANYAYNKHMNVPRCEELAQGDRDGLVAFLKKNATEYPLYPQAATPYFHPFPNQPDSSQFVF